MSKCFANKISRKFHKIIEEFKTRMEDPVMGKICRVCLVEEGDMKSVFVPDERTGTTIHLAEMIMAYAAVQITLGDGLPESICYSCAEKVSSTYIFKQLCEESDTVLRQRFGKSPLLKKDTPATVTIQGTEQSEMAEANTINIIIKPDFDLDNETRSEDADFNNENIETLDEDFIEDERADVKDDSDSDYSPKKVAYKCDICKKSFSRQSHLTRHRSVHVEVKSHVCTICQKGFARKDLLVRHKAVHEETQIVEADEEDGLKREDDLEEVEDVKEVREQQEDNQDEKFSCAVCAKEFARKESLSSHMRTHMRTSGEKERVLVCHVCSKKFVKPSHLTRHLKIHATVKAHVCNLCNKGFARGEQLANHMNAHSGIKPHVCNVCSKGFNQVSNLKDHMRTHNGEKPFLCSTCGKGFNQLGNLRQHTIRHSGVKAHLCSICGNGFASKGELGAHLRKHTGARPFVCAVCNHGFTTSSSLTKHKRIHSGEKPYECEVCRMRFSRSGILARHRRTHTGEKPYVCKFCAKAFAQSNDLSSHLRIHTGEKPFICDACGQAFRQSSALKTHKKTHLDRAQLLPLAPAPAPPLDSKAALAIMHTSLLGNVTLQ